MYVSGPFFSLVCESKPSWRHANAYEKIHSNRSSRFRRSSVTYSRIICINMNINMKIFGRLSGQLRVPPCTRISSAAVAIGLCPPSCCVASPTSHVRSDIYFYGSPGLIRRNRDLAILRIDNAYIYIVQTLSIMEQKQKKKNEFHVSQNWRPENHEFSKIFKISRTNLCVLMQYVIRYNISAYAITTALSGR